MISPSGFLRIATDGRRAILYRWCIWTYHQRKHNGFKNIGNIIFCEKKQTQPRKAAYAVLPAFAQPAATYPGCLRTACGNLRRLYLGTACDSLRRLYLGTRRWPTKSLEFKGYKKSTIRWRIAEALCSFTPFLAGYGKF